ncbi:MAG: SPFH domain-containing protein [Sedimentisphaerales bacterium]|jgi:membrane protease subunit HflK
MKEEHGHHHEHEHNHDHATPNDAGHVRQADPGYDYLSGALKVSFAVLKVIMVILIILFLLSGIRTVGPGERAIVLRFGKISGVGEGRLLGPGLKLLLPYPIHEIVRVPVEKKVNLAINSFWYYQKPGDEMGDAANPKSYALPTLNPLSDGYCLVRGEKQEGTAAVSEGSDYNILHCKWVLTYQITDAERFYKHCYVQDEHLSAGQNYSDIIEQNINPMLENVFSDAVVATMVNYTIEEAMFEKVASVTDRVKERLQNKLNALDSGIKVVSVQIRDITWPRQVGAAFQASLTATQDKQKAISEAKLNAEKILNETGGPIAGELLASLHDSSYDKQKQEQLWGQVAGRAQEQIADSRGYRTKVVEDARANAEYLQRILPEYRKYPKLVIQRVYQDAIEQVLRDADEKTVIEPAQHGKATDVRVLINRDPGIKPKSEPGK